MHIIHHEFLHMFKAIPDWIFTLFLNCWFRTRSLNLPFIHWSSVCLKVWKSGWRTVSKTYQFYKVQIFSQRNSQPIKFILDRCVGRIVQVSQVLLYSLTSHSSSESAPVSVEYPRFQHARRVIQVSWTSAVFYVATVKLSFSQFHSRSFTNWAECCRRGEMGENFKMFAFVCIFSLLNQQIKELLRSHDCMTICSCWNLII